jgi:hypothetical protein
VTVSDSRLGYPFGEPRRDELVAAA